MELQAVVLENMGPSKRRKTQRTPRNGKIESPVPHIASLAQQTLQPPEEAILLGPTEYTHTDIVPASKETNKGDKLRRVIGGESIDGKLHSDVISILNIAREKAKGGAFGDIGEWASSFFPPREEGEERLPFRRMELKKTAVSQPKRHELHMLTGPASMRGFGRISDAEALQELKKKVESLEQELESTARCRICEKLHRVPVVSLRCRHVFCQDCWLKALGVALRCPRCAEYSTPNMLRRIYL